MKKQTDKLEYRPTDKQMNKRQTNKETNRLKKQTNQRTDQLTNNHTENPNINFMIASLLYNIFINLYMGKNYRLSMMIRQLLITNKTFEAFLSYIPKFPFLNIKPS